MAKSTSEYIEVSKIIPDENQPRKYFDAEKIAQLIKSIKRQGILSPVTVERIGQKYLLVDGERRFRAATELGLKEIPCVIIAPQNETQRLIQQFNLQEMHEGWTGAEKAMSITKIVKDMGIPLVEACDAFGISPSMAGKYIAFGSLIDKKAFLKSELSLKYAQKITAMKVVARKAYRIMEKEFSLSDEKTLENALIHKVKDGGIKKYGDFTKLTDSVRKDPKSIDEIMKTHVSAEGIFIKSKAKDAYHLRNLVNNSRAISTHIKSFNETGSDVALVASDIYTLKNAKKSIESILARVE